MSLLSKLMPREDKFHVLMKSLGACAHRGAILLKDYVESQDEAARRALGQDIADNKITAKGLMERITQEAALTFVTPFDREDIQDLSAHLYKIPKTIDKIRERMDLHGIQSDAGDFSRQADLIVQEAAAMEEILEALTNHKDPRLIVEKERVLNALEVQGDEILGEMLKKLFTAPQDVRDLLLRKDIYDMLEKVLDRYRDAAGIALQIVLKHS